MTIKEDVIGEEYKSTEGNQNSSSLLKMDINEVSANDSIPKLSPTTEQTRGINDTIEAESNVSNFINMANSLSNSSALQNHDTEIEL